MKKPLNSQLSEHLECINLKFLLHRDLRSLERLVDEIRDRAEEAARETHPSLDESKRFRRAFSACCEVYLFTAAATDDSGECDGTAVYDKVSAAIKHFLRDIMKLLPMTSRKPEMWDVGKYNWGPHFDDAAKRARGFAAELEPYLRQLKTARDNKQHFYDTILETNSELRKVLS